MSTPTKTPKAARPSPEKGKLSFDSAGLPGLTGSEAKVLLLGIAYPLDSGKPDYDKVAEKGGYKNASSVRTVYGNARRKLERLMAEADTGAREYGSTNNNDDDGNSNNATTASSTPAKTPRGRGRPPKSKQTTSSSAASAAAGENVDDNNVTPAETPTKPTRGRGRRKTKQADSEEEGNMLKVEIDNTSIKAEDDTLVKTEVDPVQDESMTDVPAEQSNDEDEPLFPGISVSVPEMEEQA